MLKYRLIFGILMSIVFVALMLLDGWIDGSINPHKNLHGIQGTILMVFLAILAFPAQIELGKLFAKTGAKIFLPICIFFTILLPLSFYISRGFELVDYGYLLVGYFLLPIIIFGSVFFYQAFKYGVENTIINCSVNLLAIFYLGFLSGIVMLIRAGLGVWALLMFVFTIKFSDVGAYTAGRLFGKHKFSPVISPKKTWEGMIGGVIFAAAVAAGFAHWTGLMSLQAGMGFGVIFAFVGQFGDLAESMFKRDANLKDSSNTVPGFGGILDVIDSILVAAPLGAVYFAIFARH
jgi:phosphatidate cytidylyltransferase